MTKVNVTLIVDESGSMGPQRFETISGIQNYIEELKRDRQNEYYFTLVTFNYRTNVAFRNRPISEVSFDEYMYNPNGGTALLDAIGTSLPPINNLPLQTEQFARKVRDVLTGEEFEAKRVIPHEKNIVVVVTDGEENSSHTYKLNQIKSAIEDRKYREDWAFIYLGADESLWKDAAAAGYSRYQFVQTKDWGIDNVFRGLASASSSYASGDIGAMVFAAAVADTAETEEKKRKRK